MIELEIKRIAQQINADLKDKNPIFIAVLNGSFMFAGELMKEVTIASEITFVRLASYVGTASTEHVQEVLGLNESIEGREVVIVEDIVDTGITLGKLIDTLNALQPKEVKIATLLYKPDSYKGKTKIDYIGKSISNDFIVGYGLDYDGIGRNLADIYTLL